MNTEVKRQLIRRLEALEALATLFGTLWFEPIKQHIKDEKGRAYLMVFEDAFPHLNHLIAFARRSAQNLAGEGLQGEAGGVLQQEFQVLVRHLLPAEEAGTLPGVEDMAGPEVKPEDREKEALAPQSSQDDLDSLFAPPARQASPRAVQPGPAVTEEEEAVEELVASIEEEEEEEEEGEDLESLLAEAEEETEEELEGEEEPIAEEDLEELFGEEEEENQMQAGISKDEINALLGGEEKALNLSPAGRSSPKPKGSAGNKVALPKGVARKETQPQGNGDETVSQDEIDALFG